MSDSKRTIVIADAHSLLRAGLKILLESEAGFEVVGEANNGRDTIQRVIELKPDLLITELSLPGLSGIDVVRVIRDRYPAVKTLMLTMHNGEDQIRASLDVGVNGFVLKDATQSELIRAARQVLDGKAYLSQEITDKLVSIYIRSGVKRRNSSQLWDSTTQRERQVLKLIAEGHTNKSMAEQLALSVKTVEKHRANLMKKLDLSSVPELTKYAIRKGVVTPYAGPVAESIGSL
jgi:DNA-binding NarL/FixJ family response regulator